jgi:Holliday junction DNA helicase RuvA
MFNSLYGTITAKLSRAVYLETHGVEWEILVPDTALDTLPPAGNEARVYTWLYHREDQMALFGFSSPEDRLLFLDLQKVDGVGARAALKIMSSISPEQLRGAIDNEELGRLEAVPGIGKKTAQKMMLALRGKLALPQAGRQGNAGEWRDVVTALSDMGYDRRNAESAVTRLAEELASDAGFASASRESREEMLFRRAITALSK